MKKDSMYPKINKWSSFKLFILKKWYRYILKKEFKVGWTLLPPNIVVLNDDYMVTLDIRKIK